MVVRAQHDHHVPAEAIIKRQFSSGMCPLSAPLHAHFSISIVMLSSLSMIPCLQLLAETTVAPARLLPEYPIWLCCSWMAAQRTTETSPAACMLRIMRALGRRAHLIRTTRVMVLRQQKRMSKISTSPLALHAEQACGRTWCAAHCIPSTLAGMSNNQSGTQGRRANKTAGPTKRSLTWLPEARCGWVGW